MNASRLLAVILGAVLLASPVSAQPPFGRGGDDDGDRRGFRGRGDDGGGWRGSRGRGDDDDDDGGGFRGRGGFGGGPPGGFRGGGFSGRGGPPGGRGGFDPSSFLSRLDRNGNGVLDPDEQEGPARFLISRMERSDPSIRAGRPIPLDKITEGFQRMRESRGDDDDDRRGRRGDDDDALEIELLVPGFGIDLVPAPVKGFGPAAEILSVPITAEDEQRAADSMRRADRNRDGMLDGGELSRFSGNPLDFDRNRDGKLSVSELAVRYARRREAEDDARDRDRRDRGWGRDRDREDEDREVPDPYNGRNSFRMVAQSQDAEGVPGWFADKDADGDGQVAMAEYAERWNDSLVEEFFRWDPNRDGVITLAEVQQGVEEGATSSVSSSSYASMSRRDGRDDRRADISEAGASGDGGSVTVDPKLVSYAERILGRYDKDGDGELTASEWEPMLISPAPADADRNGRVTVQEYAAYMAKRRSG